METATNRTTNGYSSWVDNGEKLSVEETARCKFNICFCDWKPSQVLAIKNKRWKPNHVHLVTSEPLSLIPLKPLALPSSQT